MNDYFERSLSKFILEKLNINSLSVNITDILGKEETAKNHMTENHQDMNGFFHETFLKKQENNYNYSRYFPLNFYSNYLNVLF